MSGARVTLSAQLECVRREIKMRERVYPRLVSSGRMTSAKAREELETMRAVEKTLDELARAHRLL